MFAGKAVCHKLHLRNCVFWLENTESLYTHSAYEHSF
jgi:hypothetical protein